MNARILLATVAALGVLAAGCTSTPTRDAQSVTPARPAVKKVTVGDLKPGTRAWLNDSDSRVYPDGCINFSRSSQVAEKEKPGYTTEIVAHGEMIRTTTDEGVPFVDYWTLTLPNRKSFHIEEYLCCVLSSTQCYPPEVTNPRR